MPRRNAQALLAAIRKRPDLTRPEDAGKPIYRIRAIFRDNSFLRMVKKEDEKKENRE
jgi:hypothetical protein